MTDIKYSIFRKEYRYDRDRPKYRETLTTHGDLPAAPTPTHFA